jgi:peptidoglycan/LPS O-acetylase OafA/YrhL
MSRLPPALARRIDRLARRAHRFHRLSHHPLCGAYAGEVVRLGRRTRLCRGCTLAAAGAVAGALAGWASPPLPVELLLLGPAVLAGWTALALAPGPRRPASKWVTRAGPAALASFLSVAGLLAATRAEPGDWSGAVTAVTAAAIVALVAFRYRRRGPDRTACPGCPQGPPGPRCDGFREVVRRERAFSRLSARWIDRARAHPCETPPP